MAIVHTSLIGYLNLSLSIPSEKDNEKKDGLKVLSD